MTRDSNSGGKLEQLWGQGHYHTLPPPSLTPLPQGDRCDGGQEPKAEKSFLLFSHPGQKAKGVAKAK